MGRMAWSWRAVIGEVRCLSIRDLKALGYLEPGIRSGFCTLSRNGEKTGSFGIAVLIHGTSDSYIKFDYFLNVKPVNYRHKIEFFPCHYGKYRIYFICRDTGKRVTALFMVNGYFSSRFYHEMVYISSRYHRNSTDL